MTKLRWAAGAAACITLAARIAAAQDPPPPMLPGDAPPPSPLPPAPPSAPDAPPPPVAPSPPPFSPPPPAFAPSPPPATFTPPSSTGEAPPEPATPEPPAPRDRRPGATARSLKGYAFPTPLLIDSAFPTTHVGLGVEVGHYWAYGQDPQFSMGSNTLTMNGTDVPFDLSQGYTTEYLSIGFAPWEKVGLTLDANYTSYLSSDVNGAAFNGSQYAWDIRPGIRFRLLRSASTGTQIGLHLYGDFTSSSQVNLSANNAILTIANQINSCITNMTMGCTISAPATMQTSTAASGGATFSLAQAFNSTLGLQVAMGAEVGYGWISSYGSSINSTPVAFHIGAAPSLNFGPSVPLTLMAEYLFTVNYVPTNGLLPSANLSELTPDAGTLTTLTHQLVAGVYYTGRSDFVVGALFTATISSSSVSSTEDDVNGDQTPVTQDQPPVRAVGAQLTARYFF